MLLAGHDVQYRYERKFCCDLDRRQVERIVRDNTACFSPVYAPRSINNIYLDTADFASYHENVAGAAHDRAKIRVRWYGALDSVACEPVLEIKIKHGHVNRKVAFPLAPIDLSTGIGRAKIHELFRQSDLPDPLRADFLKLQLVLANRYYRSYFLSADGNYRITVDTEMCFYRVNALRNQFLFPHARVETVVVELKYASELDRQAGRISQQFPFRLSRNSKYASGLQLVMSRGQM